MWQVFVGLLTLAILGLIPFLLFILRRRGALNPANFALTVSAGSSLAILVAFYLGLADVLISRRELVLSLLGLLIACVNFAVVYLTSRVFYKYFARFLAKTPGRR
jgi:hypothetical protein